MAPTNDPYFWGVDQVVDTLCDVGKPWVQDAVNLESNIREEGFDGKTLLTYDKMFSGKETLDLLGIRTARRRGLLARELHALRSPARSPGYHAWLLEYEEDSSPNSEGIFHSAAKHQGTEANNHPEVNGSSNGTDHLLVKSSETIKPNHSIQVDADSTPAAPSQSGPGFVDQTPPVESEKPPGDKRRIQAQFIAKPDKSSFQWEQQPKGTYIGGGAIDEFDVMNPETQLSTWLPGDPGDDNFVYLPRNRLPPGRRLAVNRVTQRVLRKGVRSLQDSQAALQSSQTATGQASNPGGGDQIAAESDGSSWGDLEDEELDREIEASMESERLELEAHWKKHPPLTQDRVQALINDEIARMTSDWNERKAVAHCRKAHGLWSASRRRGTKILDVVNARTQAQVHDGRLQKLSFAILQASHESEEGVRRLAQSLEGALADKLHYLWVASTIDSRQEPPRPETAHGIRKPPPKPSNHDPELIMSSDEDDFIVDDERDLPEGSVNLQSTAHEEEEDNEMVDAVQQSPVEEIEDVAPSEGEPQPQTLDEDQEMIDVEDQSAAVEDQMEPDPLLPHTPPRDAIVKKERRCTVDVSQSAPPQRKPTHDIIDLTTTPTKPTSDLSTFTQPASAPQAKKRPLFEDIPDRAPSFDVLAAEGVEDISNAGSKHWAQLGDRYKLVICMLHDLSFDQRSAVFKTLKANQHSFVWKASILSFLEAPPEKVENLEKGQPTVDFEVTRIFLGYLRRKYIRPSSLAPPTDRTAAKIRENESPHFANFRQFVLKSEDLFPDASQIYRPDLDDDEFEDDLLYAASEEDDQGELGASQQSQAKGRKGKPKEIVRDKHAVDLRLQEQQRIKDQAARRQKLKKDLAMSGKVSQDKSRLIINESKDDDDALLYVNSKIGVNIKDHQIEGVRFFWNQIITDPSVRQGCLLSHTMGLGKTMQVITFLVAIAEAASDERTRSQVPKDLRNSQTLVLCPPSLVNNWMDELIKWAPENSLGELYQVDTNGGNEGRLRTVEHWATYGGVLVMGYSRFMMMIKEAPAGDESDENEVEDEAASTGRRLLEIPNIVVADEAHYLKTNDGSLNQACHRLKTSTRLALTGSPLANHVKEYYSMIDWVAPNFLGPLQEFKQIYAHVIEHGLHRDSDATAKRKASKMLQVLKETVDPKVHRATTKTGTLAQDLPEKKEFMISVPCTELQWDLYELYIGANGATLSGRKTIQLAYDLGLICAHPLCFRNKAQNVNTTAQTGFPRDIIEQALSLTGGPEASNPMHSNKALFLIAILDEARRLGDKVLVFSHSIETLNFLENLLSGVQNRKVSLLDGKTKVSERQDMIKRFNSGFQEVYLISTTAGGVGLNIHGANRVVLFDTSWNPVHDQQAVGRAYRIGQKKPVYVYHLKMAGSFEEAMQDQAIFKTQLAQRVVDKKNPISWGKRNGEYGAHLRQVKRMNLSTFEGKDVILDRLIKNPPGGGYITKIILTDSLEQEDTTSALTREEREEATKIVKLNELRRTNPEEWTRQREQLDRLIAAREMANAIRHVEQSSIATPHNGISPHIETPTPNATAPAEPVPNTDPSQPTDASQTSRTAFERQQPHHQISQVAGNPFHGRGPQTPTDIEQPSSAGPTPRMPIFSTAPLPVAGANTFFGQPLRASTPTQSPIRTPEAAFAPERGGGLFGQPRAQQKEHFENKIRQQVIKLLQPELGEEGDRGRANEVITNIQEDLRRRDRGFLPDNQQWQTLTEMLDHDRFALATLAGTLSAKFLAKATKTQLVERLQTLNDLPKEEFQRRLFKHRGPEELEARRSSHPDRAARVVADDTARSQKPRLPSWAVSTITPGSDKDSVASKDDEKGSRTPAPHA